MKSIFPQPTPNFPKGGQKPTEGGTPIITTYIRTETEKLYDRAYEQGFNHCVKLFEAMAFNFTPAEISINLNKYINEKFPDHMKQQTNTI